MQKISSKVSYPFFWGPDEHRLQAYYRRVTRCTLLLAALMFLVNEFLIRPNMLIYKQNPDAPLSVFAAVMNGQPDLDQNLKIFAAIALYAVGVLLNIFLLPKWNERPNKIGMKSGLPEKGTSYEHVYFQVSNPVEKYAYIFFNSVLMPFSGFYVALLICMFISFLRGL